MAQLEIILSTNPNPELIKAQDELRQLIASTEELLNASISAQPSVAPTITTTTTTTTTTSPVKVDDENEAHHDGDTEGSNSEYPMNHASSSSGTSNFLRKSQDDDKSIWKIGDRCRAKWDDGKWYTARIDTISELQRYTVTYLKYGNTAEVSAAMLAPWVPAPRASLQKGTHVMAIYAGDGLLYEAIIEDTLPDNKFRVKFTEYPDLEVVSGDDMILKKATRNPVPESLDKLVIPEQLKILPTDSEKVKETKKKKIKRLKAVFHQKVKEQESIKRKNTWLDFQKGVIKGKAKKSIFASPDSVDGKVGVTGSGKEMTKYRETKKHKFEQGGHIAEDDDDGDQ